jgi:hypothetical protein
MTGKTETMTALAVTAERPGPNHSTSSGAIATMGTVCRNTVYG